jgi:hypothetical protein
MPNTPRKIRLDHHFIMGASHAVCQDYALHGYMPQPYLIVSDGCSSAPDSDIGARILSYMARKVLAQGMTLSYQDFGQRVSESARLVATAMGVDPVVLHATLMIAWVKDNVVQVYMYGDGCILLLGHGGQVRTIHVNFSNNAPYYLCYWDNEALHDEYANASGRNYKMDIFYSEYDHPEQQDFQSPLVFSFELDEYAAVVLASDGCEQFLNLNNNKKLPLQNVATRLLSFDASQESFIFNHLRQCVQDYGRQDIYPLDDVALAGLAIIE